MLSLVKVAFRPYGGVLKNERSTSNIERPTLNRRQKSRPTIQSRLGGISLSFPIPHSMFDVGRSMFICFRTVARLLGFVSLYPTYIFYQEPPDWYSSPGGFHLIPPAFPIPSTRLPLP